MNQRQLTALSMINSLVRQIAQHNSRYVYLERIIEFLTDIIREPTNNNINRLEAWVDSSDKGIYDALLLLS